MSRDLGVVWHTLGTVAVTVGAGWLGKRQGNAALWLWSGYAVMTIGWTLREYIQAHLRQIRDGLPTSVESVIGEINHKEWAVPAAVGLLVAVIWLKLLQQF